MNEIVQVFVERKAEKFPLTREILARLDRTVNVKYIDNIDDEVSRVVFSTTDVLSQGKKTLYLTVFKGTFIKPCPCTKGVVCCRYFFLNSQTGCALDCSYCILQEYLNRPFLTVYVNIADMFQSLDVFFENNTQPLRIGTGELTDSLAIDSITNLSSYLIPYFSDKKHAYLELKTKSTEIENLLAIPDHGGRTVISWSINPQVLCAENEKAASLRERLEAASLCEKNNYPLGFHIDPIVHFPNWREEYRRLIEELFSTVNGESIRWISMGSLRFSPSIIPIVKSRFPGSKIFLGELFPSFDGKMRYLFRVRAMMYRFILDCVREFDESVPVYLCMENSSMWKEIELSGLCGY